MFSLLHADEELLQGYDTVRGPLVVNIATST
jgi:hypothetical protein